MTTDPTASHTVTQSMTDALLVHLKNLREQIAAAHESVRPLEENLSLAWQEFEKAVGYLRRQAVTLQAEIDTYNIRLEDIRYTHYKAVETQTREPVDLPKPVENPDTVDKDKLLEHIFRILDPEDNPDDEELIATIQGLCDDPSVPMAVILEQVPWGPVWVLRSPTEDLTAQHSRLSIWEKSLANQLERLNMAKESLYKDPRYGLWNQREKGSGQWKDFIDQAVQQQQEDNEQLEAELEGLKEKWALMTEAR